jgi:hypothetical protein
MDRPRTTCKRTTGGELQKVGKGWKEAKGLALDRTKLEGFMKAVMFHMGRRREKMEELALHRTKLNGLMKAVCSIWEEEERRWTRRRRRGRRRRRRGGGGGEGDLVK